MSVDWSPETVSELTEEWHQACEILDSLHSLALLLEEDSIITFRRLLGTLLDNKDMIIPKEQLALALN
ncbi:hypothetical protein ES705_32439 [subsurface metagenome]